MIIAISSLNNHRTGNTCAQQAFILERVMQSNSDWPEHIKVRYGLNRRQKLPLLVALVLASIVVIGFAMASYSQSHPTIQWALRSFDIKSDQKVSIEWFMARQENKTTYCVVRAQNEKRVDVGYATVLVAAGKSNTTMTYLLNTESRAVLAEVLGCAYTPQMRVPPADFPPGVKIPAQDPPGLAPSAK